MSKLDDFLNKLSTQPELVAFTDTMSVIDELYDFTQTRFENGDQVNEAGENNGSCKLFAFAQLQGLDQAATLQCFGDYYRHDVLGNPEGTDHQNIRNFMQSGWSGIEFDSQPLSRKTR